jgi:hypothetical protein
MPDAIHPDTPIGTLEGRSGGNEALGWLLSPESETAIWRMPSCHAHNGRELRRLLHTLGTPGETIDRATRCFPEG